jgi:hypothetical protein
VNNRPEGSLAKIRTSKNDLSGVLETIAAGLSLVFARPYLLIPPLIVDLVTWLGLQISARSLLDPLRQLMIDHGGANGPAAARELEGLSERLRMNDTLAALTPSIFGGLPQDSVLNLLLAIMAPPLTGGIDRTDMYGSWGNGLTDVWDPGSWVSIVGVAVALFAAATVMIVLFRVPIARALRGDGTSNTGLLRECAIAWARLVGLLLIVIIATAMILGPIVVGAGVLVLLGVDLTALFGLALFMFVGLAAIYTLFMLDAIFIGRLGPIGSLKMSFAVVRAYLGPTARFAIASIILATGALQVWSVIVQNTPGVFIALIGNAVLGTGLSIASMMFFQDRSQALAVSVPTRNNHPAKSRWFG